MAFIVFEGGDGSGKSTQARLLAGRLRRRNCPLLLTHEPGGTPLGESLRRLLKGQNNLSSLSELLLFISARSQLVSCVIHPALREGATVICDRFTASTVAYQGYGRGLDLELIQRLNSAATGEVVPDLTVFLDIPVEVGLERRQKKGSDTFDDAPEDFHRRVREGYLAQIAQNPEQWLVLDATRDRRDLSAEIWAKVQPLL